MSDQGTAPARRDPLPATSARVGLGRTGTALPTAELLAFQADHAQARDAVHATFDADRVAADLTVARIPTVLVSTRSTDRVHFLRHPESGRRLSSGSREMLAGLGSDAPDVALILSDGLSATAANRHGPPLVIDIVGRLLGRGVSVGPVVVAPFARVGLLNDVGAALGARSAAIVLGERPGLSAPDGLSVYSEYSPRHGLTDADRNCIANVRPGGLPLAVAADRAVRLLAATLAERLSGVALTVEYSERPALDR